MVYQVAILAEKPILRLGTDSKSLLLVVSGGRCRVGRATRGQRSSILQQIRGDWISQSYIVAAQLQHSLVVSTRFLLRRTTSVPQIVNALDQYTPPGANPSRLKAVTDLPSVSNHILFLEIVFLYPWHTHLHGRVPSTSPWVAAYSTTSQYTKLSNSLQAERSLLVYILWELFFSHFNCEFKRVGHSFGDRIFRFGWKCLVLCGNYSQIS